MEDDETPFIERIDDLDAFLSRRGSVQTDSNEQAFGVISALSEWDPRVNIVTQEYFPDAIAIEARIGELDPLQPNTVETMAFDPDAWNNKLDAYPHWQTAWWREVIQNASDARGPEKLQGATQVDLECYEESYTDIEGVTVNAIRVSAYDNGVGMSEDTLRNAFLSWSGSMKPAGSTGGFGDAKELIIIPWLGYEIHTRDHIARGRHNEFEISQAPYLDGTKVTTWMPVAKATSVEYARAFLDKCYLPNLRIRVNGKSHNAKLTSTSLVKGYPKTITADREHGGGEVGQVAIYHNNRTRRRGVFVRSNGVFMFQFNTDESKYKGSVLIELTGEPRMLFDQKRVRFSGATDVEYIVDAFIRKLTVDPRSSLKKARADGGKERTVYGGSGAVEVAAGEAARIAAQMSMDAPVSDQKIFSDGSVSFTKDSVETVIETLLSMSMSILEGPSSSWAPAQASSAKVMLADSKFQSAEDAANALRMMAWKPAFLLVNEVDYFSVPADVKPENMSSTYKTLAILWMEICRFVLMRLGYKKPFGVGWIFEQTSSGTTVAAATNETVNGEEVPFLLLNPINLTEDNTRYDVHGDILNITYKKKLRWKTGKPGMLKTLCAVAIHECTHMVDGIGEHDEDFVAAMTLNMGKMIDMLPVAKKIRKAVMAQAKKDKEATPKVAGPRTIAAFAKNLGLSWESVGGRQFYGSLVRRNSSEHLFSILKDIHDDGATMIDIKTNEERYFPNGVSQAKRVAEREFVAKYGGVPADWTTAIKDAKKTGVEFGVRSVFSAPDSEGIRSEIFIVYSDPYGHGELTDYLDNHRTTYWPTPDMAMYEAARRILGKPARDSVEDMRTTTTHQGAAQPAAPTGDRFKLERSGRSVTIFKDGSSVGDVTHEGAGWWAYFDHTGVSNRAEIHRFDSEQSAIDFVKLLADELLPKYDTIPYEELPTGDDFAVAIALVAAMRHGEPGKEMLRGLPAAAQFIVGDVKEVDESENLGFDGWFWWQLSTMIMHPERSGYDSPEGKVWDDVPIGIPVVVTRQDLLYEGREVINVIRWQDQIDGSKLKWSMQELRMLVAALRSVYKRDSLKRVGLS